MRRGFGVQHVGGLLLTAIIVGLCLPILDPFLQMGITATGGVTAMLLYAVPFAFVLALFIAILRAKNEVMP